MAKRPQREVVEEIIKNLVQSDIAGIQIVAKDMAERVKKLEEHSIRIKKYADEIERLAADAASEKYDKESLDELVLHLEDTLAKLRKKQIEGGASRQDNNRAKPALSIPQEPKKLAAAPEPRKVVVAEKPAPVVQKPPVVPRTPVAPRTEEIVPPLPLNRRVEVYTTPEGFLVRKIRI